MHRMNLVVLVLMVVLTFGGLLTYLTKHRADADRLGSHNNLRELAFFAAQHEDARLKQKPLPERLAVPAGTVPNPALVPDQRLSWVVEAMPLFNQRRQNCQLVLAGIDRGKAWDAEPNIKTATTSLKALLAPTRPAIVASTEPARTQYVGVAGVGSAGAELPADSPQAGAFHYDTATPFTAFTDGLSQTLLFGETNQDLGPWIRGGRGTVRGVDADTPTAFGTSFGGVQVGGAYFAFADGRAEFLRDRVNPSVFRAMATRQGGPGELEWTTD